MVLSAIFFAASGIKTFKQNKTKIITNSSTNSVHNGTELANAD